METKFPKVSIIIPVYNAAEFLRNSLDSVLAQTIGSLEVLCTDDGSSDDSLAILQEYAAKDRRVRVFQQENKGAGPARNMGLANARGEFVVFMDGDDGYPENDTLERLYNVAKEHNCSVVAGYRTMLTEKGQNPDIHDPLYKLAQQNPDGLLLHYSDVQFDFNYQCYFFARSLLTENDITFPDYRRCQDPPFLVKAMIAADQFFLVPISSYVYRWGHQNIQWNKRKTNDLLKAHIDLLRMSRDAKLDKLHRSVASRVENKYKNIILSCLNRENLELVALLTYANSITDFQWLQSLGEKERKSPFYNSVTEMIHNLAKVITIAAGTTEDTVSKYVEEIYGYYAALPNADERFLNDVMLCVLAQLFDWTRPHYVRKQLADFVGSPRCTQISANCSQELVQVVQAKEMLNTVAQGYEFWNKIHSLRDEQSRGLHCLHDSRTGNVPKVSVIIPVYNVQNYIAECLESLVNQTCKDIEIICVNDQSTDSSLDIVMEYARKFPNFVVLHQLNCGLSGARNSGLKYARGEYVHFLDSDDSMKINSYELLLDKALTNQLDLLFFDGESLYEDEQLKFEYPWYETGYTSKSVGDKFTDAGEYFINAIVERDYRISACMYLVRRELLEQYQIRFLEGIVHEDNYFTYVCTLLSQRTSHLSEALYNRRVVRGSITIRKKQFRHAYGYFYSYIALRKFLDRSEIPHSIKDIASLKLIDMLKNARNEYEKIEDEHELQYYLLLPAVESELFYLMVANPVFEMEARALKYSGRQLIRKQSDTQTRRRGGRLAGLIRCCLDHGVGYTVKYGLSKVRKKVNGGVRCCKEHGVLYTVKRAFAKVFR